MLVCARCMLQALRHGLLLYAADGMLALHLAMVHDIIVFQKGCQVNACAVQVYLSDNGASWAKVASGAFEDTDTLKTFTLPTAMAAMGFQLVAKTEAGA